MRTHRTLRDRVRRSGASTRGRCAGRGGARVQRAHHGRGAPTAPAHQPPGKALGGALRLRACRCGALSARRSKRTTRTALRRRTRTTRAANVSRTRRTDRALATDNGRRPTFLIWKGSRVQGTRSLFIAIEENCKQATSKTRTPRCPSVPLRQEPSVPTMSVLFTLPAICD